MDIETYREYCLSKSAVTEEFPFDSETLVFKVATKMFALTDVDSFESINLKCDPEEAILLREKYTEIIPGWHMSKKHWNTVSVGGSLTDHLLFELIDKSYTLVVNGLPLRVKKELNL